MWICLQGGFHPMRGGPMISSGAVIASAPVIRRQFADSGRGAGGGAPSSGPAVVTAEPQLRNLRQETVKVNSNFFMLANFHDG